MSEAISELISAVRTINHGRVHQVRVGGDDEPVYWQRKEWVDWILELATKAEAVLAQVEIPPEVAAIGELIRTQDNRCTDQPMFAVMEKREVVTLDTHDYNRIVWIEVTSGDYTEACEETAGSLEAKYQAGKRTFRGWERYAMKEIDTFVTAAFTEQACRDHIAINGHNLRKPFIYAFGSYRNREFQTVRKWLAGLEASV